MLLTDVLPFEYNVVEGQQRKGVLMTLEGVFQRADTKNANGRVYPKTLWNNIMGNKDVNERLGSRRMLGELDHPASGSTSMMRASHIVTEHKLMPDGTVRGKLEILDTPPGRVAKTLLDAGVKLGVSSRGDGSVEKKGEVDEVQNDFRLETYDIVLKPSTPGAYPRIVESEEAAKENVTLIAQAVEGLVKSTDDVEVLLECHKIISVLEGCESRCESILTELKQKLGRDEQEKTEENEPEETDMAGKTVQAPSDQPPGITMSPEMKDYLKEWVDRGVEEAVAEKDEQINKLNERIASLTEAKEDLEKKVSAAEELIDEFTRKVKELSDNASTDEELQQRHDAAVELLDEAVSRLQEFGETQRRLAAAEELLTASILRHQMESVGSYIETKIEDMDEDAQDNWRNLLSECDTVEEVDSKFEELSSLIESHAGSVHDDSDVREPLPPRQGELREDVVTGDQPSSGPKDMITQRLLSRVS